MKNFKTYILEHIIYEKGEQGKLMLNPIVWSDFYNAYEHGKTLIGPDTINAKEYLSDEILNDEEFSNFIKMHPKQFSDNDMEGWYVICGNFKNTSYKFDPSIFEDMEKSTQKIEKKNNWKIIYNEKYVFIVIDFPQFENDDNKHWCAICDSTIYDQLGIDIT